MRPLIDSLLARLAGAHARTLLARFYRSAKLAARTQERVLQAKVRRNADSEFGIAHGFANLRDYHDFAKAVPIQSYEDLRPYVDRVAAGETGALLGGNQRVLMLALTSGSVDKPKRVPVTDAFLRDYRRGWNIFGIKALLDHPTGWLRGILQTTSPMDEQRTESGIPCGAISGLLANAQKRLVRKYYVCPSVVGRIADPDARYYTIMRLTITRDVSWMVTASPATQVRLARTAAAQSESLVRDIRDGSLSPPGAIEASVRAALEPYLRPDPAGAKRLDALAQAHGTLFPKHFWNLAFLANWTGGTMGLHLRDFPKYFGETPVRDIGLLATEGRVSIPLENHSPGGVLDVDSHFFEFVDAETDGTSAKVYRCHELTPGKAYRVVMTTSAGFYRYDLEDHVRVTGYLGEAPIVEFLHRGAFVSSLTGEKLTEWQVCAAFDRASRALDTSPGAFVLAPVWDDPPYYRLDVDQTALEHNRLAAAMDGELQTLNIEYRSKRSSDRLGAIRVNVLPEGELARRDSANLQRRGAANEQFKHRYLLSEPAVSAGPSSAPSTR